MGSKDKFLSKCIEKFNKAIDGKSRLAFLVAFFSTIVTHLIFFVNYWANEDSLFNLSIEAQILETGRWMPGNILSSYASPIVLMIIAASILGIISVLINKMFRIKGRIYVVMISLLLTTFPALSMSFGYSFMIERYMFGMLLSVLAVYVVDKFKSGYIVGGLILAISLGYYQSYITIAIVLSLILVIIRLIDNQRFKDNLIYILKYLAMGVIGLIMYLAVIKLIYPLIGIELLDYKGVNNVGSIPPIGEWCYLIKRTYGHVIYFILGLRFFNPGQIGVLSQIISVLISVILILYIIFVKKITDVRNLVLLLLILLLFPFGINMLDFIMYESHISTLNIYQFVFMFIFPLIIFNYLDSNKKITDKISVISLPGMICLLCTVIIVWNNLSLNNLYYTKMEMYNRSTIMLTNRIYSRIEQYDYSPDTKLFLGNMNRDYENRVSTIIDDRILFDQGLWDLNIGYTAGDDFSDYKFHELLENLFGVKYKQIDEIERKIILNSEEYNSMDVWPSPSCIKYIGDTLVVKFS